MSASGGCRGIPRQPGNFIVVCTDALANYDLLRGGIGRSWMKPHCIRIQANEIGPLVYPGSYILDHAISERYGFEITSLLWASLPGDAAQRVGRVMRQDLDCRMAPES